MHSSSGEHQLSRKKLMQNLQQLKMEFQQPPLGQPCKKQHSRPNTGNQLHQHEKNKVAAHCQNKQRRVASQSGGMTAAAAGAATAAAAAPATTRGSSTRRRCQMIQSHLSARRACRSDLQSSLYKFLDSGQRKILQESQRREQWAASAMSSAARAAAQEQNRRRLLLDAIGALKRMPSLGGESASNSVNATATKMRAKSLTAQSASTAESKSPSGPAIAHLNLMAPPLGPAESCDVVDELFELNDNLRFLSLACRLKPSLTRCGSGADHHPAENKDAQLFAKIDETQRMVARMLRQCGGGPSGCPPKRKPKPEAYDPLFWRCPMHEELRCHPPPPPPPADTKEAKKGRRRCPRGDPVVGGMVRRAKAALLGDPVFQISRSGREVKWGQMKMPVCQRPVHNSADQIGRENVHKLLIRQRRVAAAGAIEEFADRVEEKWEEIEEARSDRAIRAACRRLRKAIRSEKGVSASCAGLCKMDNDNSLVQWGLTGMKYSDHWRGVTKADTTSQENASTGRGEINKARKRLPVKI